MYFKGNFFIKKITKRYRSFAHKIQLKTEAPVLPLLPIQVYQNKTSEDKPLTDGAYLGAEMQDFFTGL